MLRYVRRAPQATSTAGATRAGATIAGATRAGARSRSQEQEPQEQEPQEQEPQEQEPNHETPADGPYESDNSAEQVRFFEVQYDRSSKRYTVKTLSRGSQSWFGLERLLDFNLQDETQLVTALEGRTNGQHIYSQRLTVTPGCRHTSRNSFLLSISWPW